VEKSTFLASFWAAFLLLLSQITAITLDFWENLVYDELLSLKDISFLLKPFSKL